MFAPSARDQNDCRPYCGYAYEEGVRDDVLQDATKRHIEVEALSVLRKPIESIVAHYRPLPQWSVGLLRPIDRV